MKAIFLVRDNPYPPVNGYKKRNYYLLEELKQKGFETELFIAKTEKALWQKILLLILGIFSPIPFSAQIRTNKDLKDYLEKHLKENPVDLIICDGIHKSLNMPFNAGGKKILYEHNIESEIAKRYARIERNIFKKIFACMEYLKFKNLQKKLWPKFDYCVACSELDKEFMSKIINEDKVIIVDNGVDLESFAPWSSQIEPNTIVYTGQIGWHPNEDALIYFTKKIMPAIKKAIPGLKLWIVGANPSPKIKSLAGKNPNIIVTGFVNDVREYIAKATVFIVPLRIGSGTRIKILEALGMQKAVISTSIGCEGLEVRDNEHLLIRDNPEEFAQGVIELLDNEGLRIRLGENGRRLVEEKYGWKNVFKGLDKILT
ncbi:MAG: glycosyltransferase family 4 protein [Candidatus Omnitrophota bacterium]